MKIIFTFILSFLSLTFAFTQTCPPDDITLTSQADIDNFATNYPGCTEIEGKLAIIGDSSSITNLAGLSQLTYTSILHISSTDLTDISGLENIDSTNAITIEDNSSLLNLDGFLGMTLIDLGIIIQNNASLNDITGLMNVSIESNIIVGLVFIVGNPNLSFCSLPNLCDLLDNNAAVSVNNNAPGCNSDEEFLFNCSQLARIKNLSFYDANQNKIQDGNEPYYSDILVTLNPGDINMFGSPAIHYTELGDYTVVYSETDNENWLLTTDSTSYSLSVGAGEEVTFAFGVYPSQLVSEQTSFITSPNARCNTDIIFNISTRNTGTTVTSGTMWLQIDEDVTQTNFIDTPDTIVTLSPPYYGWYFTDLYPGEVFTKQVELGIPGPQDFPVGDFLNFASFTQYTDANGMHTSEGFRYDAEVRCSFDPNDKLVSPERYHNEVLFDEDLIYTVRFQNTGNDVAYDVTIRDTLDTDLDWSTFSVLGSSHSEVLNTSLDDDGVIVFDFKNIFLPDSTSNLEGSNGYVTYMIRALEGIDENTVIRNSAGIYFDQNPPVITNTTVNIMVSMLTSTTTPDPFPDLIIRPNPNIGTFQVEGILRGTYQLLNTTGQVIQTGKLENDILIDISKAAQGVYFIQMLIDEHIVTRRVVKL